MLLKNTNIMKVLIIYRYICLVITSVFYILGVQKHILEQRLIIIVGMTFTAVLAHYLYMQNKGNKKKIGLIILIETIGNCILIIPSGGLQSPYIWYILSTIIMAGIEMGFWYLLGNTVIYLICMISTSYSNELKLFGNIHMRVEDLSLITGFVFSAVMIQLLINHLRELEEKNNQVQHYLDYTLKLYETIYFFTTQNDKIKLIHVILEYLREVRKSPAALYVEFTNKGRGIAPYSYGMVQQEIDKLMGQIQMSKLNEACQIKELGVIPYKEAYLGIPIRYDYDIFGILVVKEGSNIDELKFIAYVSGMMFKKINIERLNEELIISNEQNRIANEIHDSTIQQLFGISCNLFTMAKRVEHIDDKQFIKELKEMRGIVTATMRELRTTIYGMSWNKQGKNSLIEKLEEYVKTMQNLHHVAIKLDIQGDLNDLSIEQQKALYRVSCEGIANGIKHGKATQMSIKFKTDEKGLTLDIQDNGVGFDYAQVVAEKGLGLGIKNMEQVIRQIYGKIHIHSAPRQGTAIHVYIDYYKNREEGYLEEIE